MIINVLSIIVNAVLLFSSFVASVILFLCILFMYQRKEPAEL
ncbi:MAG: AgrD family cyclic lactone autoinducer peptide [Anaerovoracaceae bacterium]